MAGRFRLGLIGHGMWPSTYLVPGVRAVRHDLTRGLSREGLPSIEDGYRAQLVMDAVTQSLERRETTTVQR